MKNNIINVLKRSKRNIQWIERTHKNREHENTEQNYACDGPKSTVTKTRRGTSQHAAQNL